MRYILPLLCLLWACSDEGAVRQDQKVLPNEDPTTYYKTVPQTDLASTNVIKQRLAETRPLAIPVPPPTNSGADNTLPALQKAADLRILPKEERLARLRQIREDLTGAKPKPDYSPPMRERDTLTVSQRNRSTSSQDARPSKPKEQKQPKPANRPPGGSLFAVSRIKSDGLLKPGELFRAKLIGRVDVSSLSPFVLAEVFDPDGLPLGRAIGRASLHPVEKTKALLTFSQLILADGTVDGRLVGLDMELGQGLRGRLHKGNFRKILLAFTNTLLAALSLEVDTGDSFAEVFKFNLTKNLFDQAQGPTRRAGHGSRRDSGPPHRVLAAGRGAALGQATPIRRKPCDHYRCGTGLRPGQQEQPVRPRPEPPIDGRLPAAQPAIGPIALTHLKEMPCSHRDVPLNVILFFLALAVLVSGPILAATGPSVTDNVITRGVWYLTNIALYGVGGALVFWGVILAAWYKLKGEAHDRRNPWTPIAFGLLILAAPSILDFGMDFFNSAQGVEGALDEMQTGMEFD